MDDKSPKKRFPHSYIVKKKIPKYVGMVCRNRQDALPLHTIPMATMRSQVTSRAASQLCPVDRLVSARDVTRFRMLGCDFQNFLSIFGQKFLKNNTLMAIKVTSRAVSFRCLHCSTTVGMHLVPCPPKPASYWQIVHDLHRNSHHPTTLSPSTCTENMTLRRVFRNHSIHLDVCKCLSSTLDGCPGHPMPVRETFSMASKPFHRRPTPLLNGNWVL